MKKYLMTGVAAIAICAGFTSCSKSNELYDPELIIENEAANVIENYNQAFIATFGQPATNQDWGFGTRAFTRTNPGDDFEATSTGINANANEWADPDKQYGGWVVPDALTPGQKERVRAYFQANPNLKYDDPHFRHFFVQQVYKGGAAQAGVSSENITAADGSEYNSDNMNLLTVGENHQHINNFNKGTATTDVLDNGQSVGGSSHSDEIMLMVNIDDTSCFGYHETGSSTHHDNKAALVSAAIIDAWAAANDNIGEAVTDKWNRSFLGFDLAIQEGEQAYAKDEDGNVIYATYDQAPAQPMYGWDGEKVFLIKETETIQHEGWTETKYGDYLDEYKTIMGIGWLTTNENFYVAADKVKLTDEYSNGEIPQSSLNNEALKDVLVFKDVQVPGAQNNKAHVINLKRIKELVDDGYLPVNNKSLTEWVKVGKSDGYFTDWIVTLTEAQRIPDTTPEYDIRIIAEDLNATAADGDDEDSDWDFNDVVFDVKFKDGGKADIKLRAAGGVLPLYVAGVEVHTQFGVGTAADGRYPMINTYAGHHEDYDAKVFEVNADPSKNGKDIVITVTKTLSDGSTKDFELTANAGQPAAKIGVSPDFEWCNEREDIRSRYSNFVNWVTTTSPARWWSEND